MLCSQMLQPPSPQRKQNSLSRLELLRLRTETALPTTHVLHSQPQPYRPLQIQMRTILSHHHLHGDLEAMIKLLDPSLLPGKHQWANSCNLLLLLDFAPLLPRTQTCNRLLLWPQTKARTDRFCRPTMSATETGLPWSTLPWYHLSTLPAPIHKLIWSQMLRL
jgi:hypothetical protein